MSETRYCQQAMHQVDVNDFSPFLSKALSDNRNKYNLFFIQYEML